MELAVSTRARREIAEHGIADGAMNGITWTIRRLGAKFELFLEGESSGSFTSLAETLAICEGLTLSRKAQS